MTRMLNAVVGAAFRKREEARCLELGGNGSGGASNCSERAWL